jgi:arginase family enzyme
MPTQLHIDLDGAWPADLLPARLDLKHWGKRLRYCAPEHEFRAFAQEMSHRPARYRLLGSGDFHQLTVAWIEPIDSPFALIAFDNHPDWDVRPPRRSCGSWVSRALELPNLVSVGIWGCGNFELHWPHRLFANWRGVRSGRATVFPWEERLTPDTRRLFGSIAWHDWRERFERYCRSLSEVPVYVTVDLDCLRADEAVSNWEHGLFSASDIAWAIRQLRSQADILGGDLCGAASLMTFARWAQAITARFDHPKLPVPEETIIRERNLKAFHTIWPALVGE